MSERLLREMRMWGPRIWAWNVKRSMALPTEEVTCRSLRPLVFCEPTELTLLDP